MSYTVTWRNAISSTGLERRTFDTLAEAEAAAPNHRPWNNTAWTIRETPKPDPVREQGGVTIVGPTAFGSYRFVVDGREVVTVQHHGTQWHVFYTRMLGTGRYLNDLDRTLQEAQQMAHSYTLCRKPVACRLCKLPARHDGPCQPWE